MSSTDEQLIARVMAGDSAALAPLVERYHGPLLAYLYRLTGGDRPLAEDLVQDTFEHVIGRHEASNKLCARPDQTIAEAVDHVVYLW